MNYNTEKLSILNKQLSISINKYSSLYHNFDTVLETACKTVCNLISSDDTNIGNFLVHTIYLAHYGYLENDCNIGKLKSKITDIDLKFGYSDIKYLINTVVGMFESAMVDKETPQKKVETILLSNIRDIPLIDYKDKISDDIELVYLLYNYTETNINETIRDIIKSNTSFNSIRTQAISGVLKTYELVLQDSFGLRQFEGILTGASIYGAKIGTNYKVKQVDKPNLLEIVTKELLKIMPITFSSERQFNIKEIVEREEIIYYPLKIIEYMLGRIVTKEQSEYIYRQHEKCSSWGTYAKEYVKPQIEEYILDALYYSLEKNIDFSKSNSDEVKTFTKKDTFSFNSKEFQDLYSKNEKAIKDLFLDGSLTRLVMNDIKNVVGSLCSMVVLVKYNTLNKQLNSIKLRIVDIRKTLRPEHTTNLFSNLTYTDRIEYEKGYNIALDSNNNIIKADGVPIPYDIYEYAHDYNYEVTNAEPMFGYKVVETLMNQGKVLDWNNIILGEDRKGTTILANIAPESIHLHSYIFHNIFAGTRAGKGVMTLNILASAISAQKPVFYLDRKPDMASMFYNLCGENMFIMHGGQINSAYDVGAKFNDKDGEAILGWQQAYDKIPDYIKKGLGMNDRTYVGVFGDLIYQRAIIFILGIIMARVTYRGDTKDEDGNNIYEMLGGKNGIIAVIDEYSNWQDQFEKEYIHKELKLSCFNVAIERDKISKLKVKLQKDEITLTAKEEANAGKEKPSNTLKERLNVELSESALSSSVDPFKLYCTQFMAKYGETIAEFKSKSNAGLKEETDKLDVFLIGQMLKQKPYIDGSPFKSSNDGWNKGEGNQDTSLTRGIFTLAPNDWFIGRNDKANYLNMWNDTELKTWLDQRSYWLYYEGTSFDSMSDTTEGKKRPSGAKMFKPYLVLNNAKELDPKISLNPKDIENLTPEQIIQKFPDKDFSGIDLANFNFAEYDYVRQCSARINSTTRDPNTWESVRLKHLPEEYKQDAINGVNKHYGKLNDGIGFEGLINLVLKSTGDVFNPSTSLRKSADIANYVANKMGYSTYKELLFDLTPDGMFSTTDIVASLKNSNYFKNKEAVIPLYSEFGNYIKDKKDETEKTKDTDLSLDNFDCYLEEDEVKSIPDYTQSSSSKTTIKPQANTNSLANEIPVKTQQPNYTQTQIKPNALADSIYAEEKGLTLNEIVTILTDGIVEYANNIGFKLNMDRNKLKAILHKKLSERGYF